MTSEAETAVLSNCLDLLGSLSPEQSARVARYMAERFDTARDHGNRPTTLSADSVKKKKGRKARSSRSQIVGAPISGKAVDVARLANQFKGSENYRTLAALVLDQPDLLNRVIVALAIYRQVYGDASGITSGEIAQLYIQLGVKIGVPHISTTLSGKAKQFVMSDSVRKKGVIMRYRLSHHGLQKAKELGSETEHDRP